MDNVEKKAREAEPFAMSSEGMARRNGFKKGYIQAIKEIILFIEEGEGWDIVSGYGEKCELVDAIKRNYLQ